MRGMSLAAMACVLIVLAGCDGVQYRVVTKLPPPVFGAEMSLASPAPPAPRPAEAPANTATQEAHPPAPVRQAGPTPDPVWLAREAGASERAWRYIIIHHSASLRDNAATMDEHHRNENGWDELGYDFVIGNGSRSGDGQIEVGSRWRKQKHGAHCKTNDERFNQFGIGICLVGNFEQSRPSARQMASLQRLVEYLAWHYRIPAQNIFGHGEAVAQFPAERRATKCPGRYFSMDAFRRTIGSSPLLAERR